ncbi:MAG: FixH family protein [Alphaproteobacteria bacterium]
MTSDTNRLWARKTLFLLLAVFAVVLGVNIFMAYLAVTSSRGVVSPTAYEDGLAYNTQLAAQATQQHLGWALVRATHTFPASLTYTLADAQTNPLSGATVTATVQRPLNDAPAQTFTLTEATAGTYTVATPWPRSGPWDVTLTVQHGPNTFHATERVMVP